MATSLDPAARRIPRPYFIGYTHSLRGHLFEANRESAPAGEDDCGVSWVRQLPCQPSAERYSIFNCVRFSALARKTAHKEIGKAVLPQANTRLCDGDERNCVSPYFVSGSA